MDIKLIEELEEDLISLEEVKTHLRVEHNVEDDYLISLLKSAIDFCENYTRRSISKKRVEFLLIRFPPGVIRLPLYPVQEIVKISYLDTNEQLKIMEFDIYRSVLDVEPPVIIPNTSWPNVLNLPASIRIEAIVGYENIPKSIKQAVLLLCAHFYENREVMRERYVNGNEIPFSVSALLYPYKVLRW